VEVALRLNEQNPPGEVVAVALGPDAAQETLRKALSMGVDRGIHLAAAQVPFDGLAIAHALAAELKDGGFDLILFGRTATDTGNGTVGPMTAELLGLPCVSAVSALELAVGAGTGTAERELEGATEALRFPLPAVLTIDEGIARPRLPSLKGIMAAKRKPVENRPAALGSIRLTIDKLELPPERAGGRIIGEGAGAVPELMRLLRDEAKVL
jgi:electron transfer flavoprotein beta subunit